jgi:hypothetical protein
MTISPDPDPERTPGLEPGGGVAPGDTPPESAQLPPPPDPPIPSRARPVIALTLIAVVVLLVAGFLVAQALGWAG